MTELAPIPLIQGKNRAAAGAVDLPGTKRDTVPMAETCDMNFSPPDKIYATWEQVRGNLPAWYELSPAMREAIIRIWGAGEKHALDQVKK